MVGARPNFVKIAPVLAELAEYRGVSTTLVHTGQHYDAQMSDAFFANLEIPRPDVNLKVQSTGAVTQIADVMTRLEPVLDRARPDVVVVVGDVNSTVAAALTAAKLGRRVAHVEAGLRSFDPAMPWPEEDNRVAIDALSDLLFAPTETSAANLRREDVSGGIRVTGNSGIDALLATLATLPAPRTRRIGEPTAILVTCHRRENWGVGLTSVALALIEIARTTGTRIDCVLHPNPSVRESMHLLLDGEPGIRLVEPMNHRAMISAIRDADLILSDSGGVQEEAPALGVPLLVLREKTERPEGVASGNMLLVGTDTAGIVDETVRLLADRDALAAMARPALPFGDGRAAPRIAGHMIAWLATRRDEAARRRA